MGDFLRDFVNRAHRVIEAEHEAENGETEARSFSELEKKGNCLSGLSVRDSRSALGGTEISLGAWYKPADTVLPDHSFSSGDVVIIISHEAGTTGTLGEILKNSGSDGIRGVVSKCTRFSISVLAEDIDQDIQEPCRIVKMSNDITYKRIKECISNIEKMESGPGVRSRDCVFNKQEPRFRTEVPGELKESYYGLNDSQMKAVSLALRADNFAMVHGPPGTGKTQTLAEIVVRCVERGQRVLVSAPSNVAVDNIIERVASRFPRIDMVRLGNPVRMMASVVGRSLEALVMSSDEAGLANDARSECNSKEREISKTRNGSEKRALRQEIKQLNGEIRKWERRAVDSIVDRARVVFATLVGAGDRNMKKQEFDIVIIDEAAQALEPPMWIPLLKAKTFILAGDHLQLSATVKSTLKEAKAMAAETLFARLHKAWPNAAVMLDTQYRMNSKISDWSSGEFYNGKLKSHASVAEHLLVDLPGVKDGSEMTQAALAFVDTNGCDLAEQRDEESQSLRNPGEAQVVQQYVQRLIKQGVGPDHIAVITPYSAQVYLLRSMLTEDKFPGIEIGTVDGLQGREKDAVVISLVRSNEDGDIGFLSDTRRLNVAVTRARMHLAVVGDSDLVRREAKDTFMSRFFEWLQDKSDTYDSAETFGTAASD